MKMYWQIYWVASGVLINYSRTQQYLNLRSNKKNNMPESTSAISSGSLRPYFSCTAHYRMFISLCFLFSIPALAAGDVSNQNSSNKILILTQSKDEQTLFTDMILPGQRYKSGKGWWALSCSAHESKDKDYQPCAISKTSLKVEHSSLSSDYRFSMDEEDTIGQMLHWQPEPSKETLLMFKPSASILTKLVEGTVPTYYSNPERSIFTKEGSISTYAAGLLEGELILPGGIKARLLPVIVLPGKASNLANDQINGRRTLELRIGSKHQTLVSNNFDFFSRDYLQWAGDLDGDGQLDLLINVNACTRKSVLFLSSLAKNDDLVGEAGSFEYPPMEHTQC